MDARQTVGSLFSSSGDKIDMTTWNPQLYLQFGNERTQPSIDLANRIGIARPQRVVDVGCGPGNSTAVLRQRWPDAEIVGFDSSPEMIAAAKTQHLEGTWLLADAATWVAEQAFDVVFSNAALQWLPDHVALFPHLFAQVAPGGALAVQIPTHERSAIHQRMEAMANAPQWRQHMAANRRVLTIEQPSFYYDVLQPLAKRLDMWETIYYHVLESSDAIVEWFRSTGLRPYLEALESDEQREAFLTELRAGVALDYPQQRDGRVLLPFKRLFMVAYR